jgi:hypothetical protein
MEPTELLRLVGEQLDRIGCQRFTTGSVASMVFGEPRFTNDIDIVVRMDERQAVWHLRATRIQAADFGTTKTALRRTR